MRTLRLGVIGAGRMGITHYSIINSHPKVKICSIADPSVMVTSLMGKYLEGLETFKDYNKMLKKVDLDAVLVCTPPGLHHEIIKQCAALNLHVFVEKPFTTSKVEAEELVKLYKDNGLVNQVGYVNRFNDVFIKAKQWIEEGLIGDVIRFKSEMFSCTVIEPVEESGWRSTRENGGGVVFEMASHAIDLVNYLVGKPDKVIGTSLNSIFSKNVEDIVSSTFLYDKGTSGTIYVNWSDESYRKPTNKIEIFGSKGKLLADQHGMKIYLREAKPEMKLSKGWNTIYITDVFKPVPFYVRGNEFTRQLYEFTEAILNDKKSSTCSFSDGLETLDVIDSLFKDSNSNSF